MWELDRKESWALKNWCFWTVVLEKTLESPLDCKKIQPVNPKGNQSWIFIGKTDAEAETPILGLPNAKNWLIGKDHDTGKNWRQEEKGTTEDEMAGWTGRHSFSSVQFSRLVVSDSLRLHESQHARPPCPSPTPRVHSDSRPSSPWCHPVISSSVIPFSSCPQSLPASGSFQMSQLFASGGQNIGASASTSVLPMNTQDTSPNSC